MKLGIIEELWYGDDAGEEAEKNAAKSMAARMGRIIGTKPFPIAAQRLTILTQNPDCSMDEIVTVLESDPALSARLLRLVNSAGFALRTACTSVRHAATLVGTEKLNQVASTAAIFDMYGSGGEVAAAVLEHATAVGALCRYLAFHFALPPDELFTCGFLHDIGKLMMLDTEGDDYLELIKRHDDFDTAYVEERERYGFDHALLAGHVLTAWNIPHPVPKVVAWHHHITRAYAESTLISQMVSTLRLADALSFAFDKPDPKAQIERIARMEAASYLDISEAQLAAMWDEIRSLTERARAVFRGETPQDLEMPQREHQDGRPSAQSLRAVADARQKERLGGESLRAAASLTPALSIKPGTLSLDAGPVSIRPAAAGSPKPGPLGEATSPRQFPCVVCEGPSFAHVCAACRGYVCPKHVGGEDDWCQLCRDAYEEAGIPQIGPGTSVALGALLGVLVAAAFFGAASAGSQQPLRFMLAPTLVMMLFGMLVGIGQRWVRRWWFLRTRPNRALTRKTVVEDVLSTAQSVQHVEIAELRHASEDSPEPKPEATLVRELEPSLKPPARPASRPADGERRRSARPSDAPRRSSRPPAERQRSARAVSRDVAEVRIPNAPALPSVDLPPVLSTPPPGFATPPPQRRRVWMSSSPAIAGALDEGLEDPLGNVRPSNDVESLPPRAPSEPARAPSARSRPSAKPTPARALAPAEPVEPAPAPAAPERAAEQPVSAARAPSEPPRPAEPAASDSAPVEDTSVEPTDAPPDTSRASARAKQAAPAKTSKAPKPVAPASGTRLTAEGAAAVANGAALESDAEAPPVSQWTSVLDAHGTADGW